MRGAAPPSPDIPFNGLTSTAILREDPVKTSIDFGFTTSSLDKGRDVSTIL